ncbi:hypothetical protein F4692_000725 [Nocardioides cavernae]|uniref:DUF7674 domain-containing protein n=1 Tax=Nocardioides cavernae TaxID=1921566 RepID=A0A7Y9KNE9_9ACTN|nr:hypothetical protein [Nocardioides cavernae]NYE35621.1 hypothetical protein [Nocardioides cavernae]
MTAESDFTERLVSAVPELTSIHREHLEDQEGELLAYVLMADVARWLDGMSRSEPRRAQQVIDWLEQEFTQGDFDVRNLIDVGIVEMLPSMPEGAAVLSRLGPELRGRAEVAGLFG